MDAGGRSGNEIPGPSGWAGEKEGPRQSSAPVRPAGVSSCAFRPLLRSGGADRVQGGRALGPAYLGPAWAPWFGSSAVSLAPSVWPQCALLRESGEGAAGHTSLACSHRTGQLPQFPHLGNGKSWFSEQEEILRDGPKLCVRGRLTQAACARAHRRRRPHLPVR